MAEFLNDLQIHGAGQIQFKTTTGSNAGKIDQNGNDLVLSNAVGDIIIGNGSDDVFIGDGTNAVDIRFEQNMAIFADSSSTRTLTLGGANTTLILESPTINGSVALGATTINNKLTFTSANGYIVFDYEPSTGSNAEYTNEVPLLKVDKEGTEKTILSRLSNNGALALGIDDTVAIVAGDTKAVIEDNHNYPSENIVLASEGGFIAYGFPNNDTSWSNRNIFQFSSTSTTASNNGLYLGDGSATQFIDINRNLVNIGTIGSGAITSTGAITTTSTSTGAITLNGGTGVSTTGAFILRQNGDGDGNGMAITSSNATSHRIWKDSSGNFYIGSSANSNAFKQDTAGNITIEGTISAGSNKISGGEIEGTSLDINGAADIAGKLVINTNSDDILTLNQNSGTGTKWNYINFNQNGTREWFIGQDTDGNFDLYNDVIDSYAISISRSNNSMVFNAGVSITGNLGVTGTITGSNLSGTNTGDQDLSGLLPKSGGTMTGDLTISSTAPNLILEDTNGRSIEMDVNGNTFRIDDVGNNAAIFEADLSANPVQTTFGGPLSAGSHSLTGGSLDINGNSTLGDVTSNTTTISGSTILNKKAASGTNISIAQLKTANGSTTWNIGGNNTSNDNFMIWAPDKGAGNYFQINKTSGQVKIGADTSGSDLYVYGNATGEGMFWDASESHLTIKHDDGDLGLEIYPVASTSPTAPQIKIGRDNGQYWGAYVTDSVAHLIHRQDETGGSDHFTKFQIWTNATGSHAWQWDMATNAGASVSTKMKLTDSGVLTLGGGSNTITNSKVATWDSAYTVTNAFTTVGTAFTQLSDVSVASYIRVNADETLSYLNASQFLSAIGGQASGNYITGTGSLSAQDLTDIGNLSGTNTGDQDLSGLAPKANPTFTGTPAAPTASAGTNTTQIATTAFVSTAVSNLVDSAPGTLNTLNELAAALGDDASFSTTVTNSIATKLPLAGGTMTGAIDFGNVTGRAITITGDSNLDSADASIYLGNSPSSYGWDIKYIGSGSGNDNKLQFISTNSGNPATALSFTQDGNANFGGQVGIGVDPAAGVELHVNGDLRVDSTSGVATRKIRSGYFSSTTDIIVASGSSASVRLQNGTTDGLVIDSSQNATFAGDVTLSAGNVIVGSQYGIRFNDANTRIYTNTDTPEDLIIEADQDLLLTPDGQVSITGNLAVSGTVDGRDIATDGTKLDTIDTNADVTPSWVPSSDPNYLTSHQSISHLAPKASPTFTGDITIPNKIIHTGDTNTYMQFEANDVWRVVTGGTERLDINTNRILVGDDMNMNFDGISTGNSGTVVYGGFLNPASEANMVHIPHIINDLAGFNKWSNATITTSGFYKTRSGSSGSYTYSNEVQANDSGWANAFDSHSSTAGSWYSDNGSDGVYQHGTDTPGVVELEWTNEATYSLWAGIVFGSGSFTATYVKIEAYRGGAWQTLCEITDNTDQVILRQVASNSGTGAATTRLKYTLGGSVNGNYFRIHSLYMANYRAGDNNLNNTGFDTTRGVNFLERYKDGYLHGHLRPGADDTYDLGSSSYKWKNSYFDGVVYADRVQSEGVFPQQFIIDTPGGGGSSRTMQIGMSGSSLYFKKSDTTGSVIFRNSNNTNLVNIGLADTGKVTVLNELEAGSLDINGNADISGNITVSGTVDGVDIAARDGVLTSTTTTANAALPKAGGTMTGNLKLSDSVELRIGASNDLVIQHTGTHSFITNATGDLTIANYADDRSIYFQSDDGSGGSTNYLQIDGVNEVNKFHKAAQFLDGVQAMFGNGGDLLMYHNSTSQNGIIENFTNHLVIQNNANDKDILFKSDNGSGGVTEYFRLDGSSEINVFSKDTFFIDNVDLKVGSSGDLILVHDSSNSFIHNVTGNLTIKNSADDGNIVFESDDGSGSVTEYFRLDGGNVNIITSVNNVFADGKRAGFGDSADLEIYHGSGDSYIQNDTGHIYIQNLANDKNIELQSDNGSGGAVPYFRANGATGEAILYHYGTEKLATTSTGIIINNSNSITTDSGRLQVNGAFKATGNIADVDIPYVIHTGWGDDTSTTANKIIPLGNSVTEQNVSAADGQHFFVAPYAGSVKKIIMKNVAGSLSSGFTTELKLYINGTQQAVSGELTASSSAITWEPSNFNTFSAADTISLVYQKSATSKYWREVALTMVLIMDSQDI